MPAPKYPPKPKYIALGHKPTSPSEEPRAIQKPDKPPPPPNLHGVDPSEWDMLTDAQKAHVNTQHGNATCLYCHSPIVYVPSITADWIAGFIVKPKVCHRCRKARSVLTPPEPWWAIHCPKDFKDTQPENLPNLAAAKQVLAWEFNPKGLLLFGPARRGKSRTLWLLLKRISLTRTVMVYDGTRWGNECAARFEDRTVYDWLDAQSRVEVWAIDDLDKMVFTERVKQELVALFRARCDQQLPSLFTTQATESVLEKKLDPELFDSFIQRLLEYCDAVQF